MTRFGALVGRFQCPILTEGHQYLIEDVMAKHEQVIIVVGCPRTPPNATNPMDFAMRRAMIAEKFPKAIIVPLPDQRTNEGWSKALDTLLGSIIGFDSVTLYSGRDGFLPHYTGRYDKQELTTHIDCSATEMRNAVARNPSLNSFDFRAGVVYAHQVRAHQTYHTVDCALLRQVQVPVGRVDVEPCWQILLGRKTDDEPGRYRFPGGFIDPWETAPEAAQRELREETGLIAECGFAIVGQFALRDEWRIRRQKNVSHVTTLCVGYHMAGRAQASDDLAHVEWVDLNDVFANAETMMVNDHKALMVEGLQKYITKFGHVN